MIIRFKDEYAADKWQWLFGTIMRMNRCCANGYCNAFSYT